MGLEAVPTVDRLTGSRLKRNLCGCAAFAAGGIKHFALLTEAAVIASTTLRLSGGAAFRATGRLILKAFFSIKCLLGSGKGKTGTALFTGKIFVLVGHK